MTGLVRKDDRCTIDVDDATITELHRQGGLCFAVASDDSWHAGAVTHDGESYVVRLEEPIARDARRVVKLRLRTLAQGARP